MCITCISRLNTSRNSGIVPETLIQPLSHLARRNLCSNRNVKPTNSFRAASTKQYTLLIKKTARIWTSPCMVCIRKGWQESSLSIWTAISSIRVTRQWCYFTWGEEKRFQYFFYSNGTGVPCFLLTMAMAKYLVPMPIGVWLSGPSQNGASPSPTRRQ